MNKKEKEHFEFLKKQKPTMYVIKQEIVYIEKEMKNGEKYKIGRLKTTYNNGYEEYTAIPPKTITCNDFGDGCRSGIPFNPNKPKTIDFNWGDRRS